MLEIFTIKMDHSKFYEYLSNLFQTQIHINEIHNTRSINSIQIWMNEQTAILWLFFQALLVSAMQYLIKKQLSNFKLLKKIPKAEKYKDTRIL